MNNEEHKNSNISQGVLQFTLDCHVVQNKIQSCMLPLFRISSRDYVADILQNHFLRVTSISLLEVVTDHLGSYFI